MLTDDIVTNDTINTYNPSLKYFTIFIYGLQALGFFSGVTFIIGVIMNYAKRDEIKGTWLESHFKCQIKTFWWGMSMFIIGIATYLFLIGYFILLVNSIFVLYRVITGFLKLIENKPIL